MKTWYSNHSTEVATFVAGFLFFSAGVCVSRGDWLAAAVNLIFIGFNLKLAKWF